MPPQGRLSEIALEIGERLGAGPEQTGAPGGLVYSAPDETAGFDPNSEAEKSGATDVSSQAGAFALADAASEAAGRGAGIREITSRENGGGDLEGDASAPGGNRYTPSRQGVFSELGYWIKGTKLGKAATALTAVGVFSPAVGTAIAGSPSAEQAQFRSSLKSPANPFQIFRQRMAQINPRPGTGVATEGSYVENALGDCEGIGGIKKFYVNVNDRYRNRVTVNVIREKMGYSQRITDQPVGYLNMACDNVEQTKQRLEVWTPAKDKSAESAVNGLKRVYGGLSSRKLPQHPEYVVDNWASSKSGNVPPTEHRNTRTIFTDKKFTNEALKDGELVVALVSESHATPAVLTYFGAEKGQNGEGSKAILFTKPVRTNEIVPRANHHDAILLEP
ncbi:hypothetical protein KY385_03935 [Candidatus Parcubacteria bacterium]|nr:hypothetical protein [Candidatus Parcubacteria bacterium]